MTSITAEQSSTKSNLRLLGFVLVMLPALIPVYLIHHYGVNMPYWDEWDPGLADLAVKAHQGTLAWSDFSAPHNEHRIVIPKFIYLLLTLSTRGNELALMYSSWAMACVTSICIGTLCLKSAVRKWGLCLWFLCNLLIFSPSQWENWLAGYGMINFLPMMFIAAGFVIANSNLSTWHQLAVLVLLASAATFSSLQGFLAWPMFGAILAWKYPGRDSKMRYKPLQVWSVAFALSILLYIVGYHAENAGEQHHSVALLERLEFGLAYLGNLFFNNSLQILSVDILIGSVLLALFGFALIHFIRYWRSRGRDAQTYLFLNWILIGGYTVATAALAMLFRAPVGMEISLAGRYATCTIYLPIALINLLSMYVLGLRPGSTAAIPWLWKGLYGLLGVAFLGIYTFSISWAWKDAGTENQRRYQGKARLLFINICADDPMLASYVYPKPERLHQLANQMNEMGFLHPPLLSEKNALALRDPASEGVSPDTFGAIVTYAKQPGNVIMLTGWAIFPAARRTAHSVALSYEDQEHRQIIFHVGLMGIATPEIVQKFNETNYAKCGWTTIFGPAELPADLKELHISAWAINADTASLFPLKGDIVLRR